jgi:hypothetical protein
MIITEVFAFTEEKWDVSPFKINEKPNLPLPLLGKEGILILPLPRGDTEGFFDINLYIIVK